MSTSGDVATIEWDNDAEKLLQDMEFTPGDTPEERASKIKVLAIYNARLDVREERNKSLLNMHRSIKFGKKCSYLQVSFEEFIFEFQFLSILF